MVQSKQICSTESNQQTGLYAVRSWPSNLHRYEIRSARSKAYSGQTPQEIQHCGAEQWLSSSSHQRRPSYSTYQKRCSYCREKERLEP